MKPFHIIAWSIALLVVVICVVLLVNNKDQIGNLFKEDIAKKDNEGNTPLHKAVYQGNLSRVKALIVKGADVNARNVYDLTPLFVAVINGNKDIVEILVSNGANVNVREDKGGNTPLHSAVSYDRANIAEILVSKGANVNTKNNKGYTPLDHSSNASRNLAAKYRK